MSVYYNECDPFAAAWLRELITAGLIADGEVDERAIELVRPDDLRGFVQCHFFAGVGGWSYALRLAGWPDSREVWTGSCPCQPFSSAGAQAGGSDPRDLWPVWFQLLAECRPHVVFGEQVEAAIGHGWLDRLCDDLEREGYAVGPCGLPAASVGAPHIRQRLWFVADTECRTAERRRFDMDAAKAGTQSEAREWERLRVEPWPSGDIGGMAHSDEAGSIRQRRRGLPADGESPRRDDVDGRGEAGELAHAEGSRSSHRRARTIQPEPCAGESRFWSACDWLPCRDGKARPVERGSFPLVTRLPRQLVPSGDPSAAYANATTEARVGRLRGYGNAIVPQVAQEFIEAYMSLSDQAAILPGLDA